MTTRDSGLPDYQAVTARNERGRSIPGWVLTENETKRKRDHGLPDDWYKDLPAVYAPSGRILHPAEIASAAIYWLGDESGPVSGQVVDLEQHPFIGRNPPKDGSTILKRSF